MAVRATTDGYRVQLDDGSVLDVSADTWVRHNPYPETAIERAVLSELRAESALRRTRSAALGFVARTEHTRAALERKLGARGHDPAVVAQVLDALTGDGLVDDERAARLWVEQRVGRGKGGRNGLLAGLQRLGVSREIAERVVGLVVTPADEDRAALRALERLYPTAASRELLAAPEERARALRRMVGRGHTARASRRALDRLRAGGGDGL